MSKLSEAGGKVVDGALNTATAGIAGTVFGLIAGLFSTRPNPNDHKGWVDDDAIHWFNNDGDSVANEAGNGLAYINEEKKGDMSFLIGKVTPDQMRSKLLRGGYGSVADGVANQLQILTNPVRNTGISQTFTPTPETPNKPAAESGSFLPWIIVGAFVISIVIVAFVTLKKKA